MLLFECKRVVHLSIVVPDELELQRSSICGEPRVAKMFLVLHCNPTWSVWGEVHQCLSSCTNHYVCDAVTGTCLHGNRTRPLIGVVMTPHGQVHLVFLYRSKFDVNTNSTTCGLGWGGGGGERVQVAYYYTHTSVYMCKV